MDPTTPVYGPIQLILSAMIITKPIAGGKCINRGYLAHAQLWCAVYVTNSCHNKIR